MSAKKNFRRRPLAVARNVRDRFLRTESLVQAGQTPYEVIAEQGIAQLRYYPPGRVKADKQPVVVVPPLAVNMLVYDLFPERSLVATLRDAGHPLYLIDWGVPTRKEAHYRFKTYLQEFMPALMAAVREHSGQQILSLHGWSLGAVLSYAYTALGDADIDRLVLLGPPCDYHAPGPTSKQNQFASRQLGRLERKLGWHVHRSPRVLWHAPGWMNALSFKLLSPGGTVKGYVDLLQNIEDRAFIEAHATNAAFIDGMVAYPGGVVQDIVKFLITDNVLAHGKLPIRGCEARLRDVRCKVLIVVGDKDPIVTPAASQCLVAQLKNAETEMIQVPGGHMSIVSGSQAPKQIWPKVVEWLATG